MPHYGALDFDWTPPFAVPTKKYDSCIYHTFEKFTPQQYKSIIPCLKTLHVSKAGNTLDVCKNHLSWFMEYFIHNKAQLLALLEKDNEDPIVEAAYLASDGDQNSLELLNKLIEIDTYGRELKEGE